MFKIKNYKNFFHMKLKLITLVALSFLTFTVTAHEMWIQPLKYSVKLGSKILANETVGQNFKGNSYAYLDSSFKTLNITMGDTTRAVKSRLGDIPTIQEQSMGEGSE